ncbi:MAG: hypothetical protein NC181_03660 [Clostridium sp.]|nr:hypothetical protein [Clostridium sp.]MCM1444591.1 hypothetical protein [Candidatus Amulumruptor caecigallinarius]
MWFKKNKFIILSFSIILIFTGICFYQFYDENFSYSKDYYIIKENCYEEKNLDHEYCKIYNNKENLESYININDPVKCYKELDAITLTCSIIETTSFIILQLFSPLLILIAVIGTFHSDFSSGMFKNRLMRINYKKYLGNIFKKVLKISLITPIIIILIFIISSIVTKFNFNIADSVKTFAVYEPWKYSNFFIYGLIVCLVQYLLNIMFCNIGLYCCIKNKNSFVATMMGYIIFILVEIFVYVIVYCYIINKLLGFKELTDYFNISGYWFFDTGPSCIYTVFIAFILALISFIIVYIIYRDKEKVIISYEKQNS